MNKLPKIVYPSSIIRDYLCGTLYPIYDKDGKLSVEQMVKTHNGILDLINKLATTNKGHLYQLLLNIMYNDYMVFMDYSTDGFYSDYLKGCKSYDELMDRLDEQPEQISTLISCFTSCYQLDKGNAQIPNRQIAPWTKLTQFEYNLNKQENDEKLQREKAILEALSNPQNIPGFIHACTIDDEHYYENRDIILNAIIEYYRVSLAFKELGIEVDDELFEKISSLTSQTSALYLFRSLPNEDKYNILNAYSYMNTRYTDSNMSIRETYKKNEAQSEQFAKRIK